MRSEFQGSIDSVRMAEDCIRATRKYTKGAFSRPVKHPLQGEEFPSRTLTEYYEVYPDLDLSWDMSAFDAWVWVWGDTPRIDVVFKYSYPTNKAWVIVADGARAIRKLEEAIPGLEEALGKVVESDGR